MSMHPLASVPAIRRLDVDRNDLFAIEIFGTVTPADVENLYGLLEGAYAISDRIDLFVRWTDGEDVDWTDVARDTLEDAHDHARRHLRRCAAVGSSGDVSALLRAVGLDEAEEYRRFGLDEEEQAWAWLAERA